ncbi:hypothetical protein BKN38_00440 [Helicobacter sp. CLO-3]|uniref:DUF6394 family protein n=1 Tax=unclassified Helicobacter TaxID=2593540 RepID=UPI00080492FB|nr:MULTISPECIES: DUF6394 family protein [unclassified Helicobacter]OBV28411.1 hypothetical protein BA723_02200 [Helicobacter sp. CLO-3]OHU85903.1 hypothetical protein BKN38_00440 [Helicobacter sp. CLO-3]
MDWGRIIFIFFTLSSATSTAGFLFAPEVTILFVAVALNLIATTLKIGVRKKLSSELFASSIVADLHLLPAFGVYQVFHNEKLAFVFAIGAMMANLFSLVLLLIESAQKQDSDY